MVHTKGWPEGKSSQGDCGPIDATNVIYGGTFGVDLCKITSF